MNWVEGTCGNPSDLRKCLARYRYDAFGNPLVATGTHATANKYRFSTKPLDHEIPNAQLYYYGHRYYDPTTGRWPSRDPIQEQGGVNPFGFVGNDGIGKPDAFGLASLKCIEAALEALKQAEKVLEELLKYNPVEDAKGGHPHAHGVTKPGGHYKEIKDLQRGLKNKLKNVNKECNDDDYDDCGGKRIPVIDYKTLNEIANRPIVIPPGIPPLSPGDKPWELPFEVEPKPFYDGSNITNWDYWEEATGLTGGALLTHLVISEGSRLFPPRNLIPVP